MSGITATGFDTKTLEEIQTDVDAGLLANVDPALDLSSESPLGQIRAVLDNEIAQVWEVADVAYGVVDPAAAEGVHLDNVGALRGIPRNKARKSTVILTLSLDASKTVAAGKIVSPPTQLSTKFVLLADVTSTTAGDYPGTFECQVTGPVTANAGTLTYIVTPVVGWTAVTNAADAEVGANVETDTAYRLRQESELALPGNDTVDAIRADVLQVPGVIECKVFENVTLVTDADGVPGKAFETVIWDDDIPAADNDLVSEAIRANKPAGIQSYGTGVTKTYSDPTHGSDVTIKFTRATKKRTYLSLTITANSDFDLVGGAAAVKTALALLGDTLPMDHDVIALALRAGALEVTGVTDVPVFTLGFSAAPVGTANLVIGSREIARFSTADMVVTVT